MVKMLGVAALLAAAGTQAASSAAKVDATAIPLSTLTRQADAGDAAAQYELARRYDSGAGVAMDRTRSLALFVASAAQGFGESEYRLARHYGGATGAAFDLPRASDYLERAAEHSVLAAQVELGFAHLNGSGGVSKDPRQAYRWLKQAGERGAVSAQCVLGDFYRDGSGGAVRDPAQALSWYRRTAASADRCAPRSQYRLYEAYSAGQGVSKDMPTAVIWLKRAAEAGNPVAQATLGRSYLEGRGVRKDEAVGRQWILKSREGVAPHEDDEHHD